MTLELEHCFHCGGATGKAGQGCYDILGQGPYCSRCWSLIEPLNDALDDQGKYHIDPPGT